MLSSTAKNLYWMGRYLQRAKSTARLIEATQRMALQSRGEEAAGVAAIFGMEDEFRQTQQQSSGRLASLIDFLVLDENNPSSIVSSIGAARRNAREERNNITVDVWESLNGAVARAQQPAAGRPRRARSRRADRIGEEAGGDDLRRGPGHPAARRGLQFPAARRLPRARRQHRPHPRREVPPAAAGRRPACRQPRLLRLVGGAGLHRRGPHLPAHLSQRARSHEGRRADDAAPRRAALGAPLPVDGRSQHAGAGRGLWRARRGRPAGRRAARPAALRAHRPGVRDRA